MLYTLAILCLFRCFYAPGTDIAIHHQNHFMYDFLQMLRILIRPFLQHAYHRTGMIAQKQLLIPHWIIRIQIVHFNDFLKKAIAILRQQRPDLLAVICLDSLLNIRRRMDRHAKKITQPLFRCLLLQSLLQKHRTICLQNPAQQRRIPRVLRRSRPRRPC